MARTQLVNGKAYDWSSVDIGISGMDSIEPLEISYDDEQEVEPVYGKGGKPIGYGTGNQKNSVKISVLREDFDTICKYCKKKKIPFYSLIIPIITVNYADPGKPISTDTLKGVKFSKRSFKAANGDKSMKVDLDGIAYKGIKTNGIES